MLKVRATKATGKKISSMDKVLKLGLKAQNTKESTS